MDNLEPLNWIDTASFDLTTLRLNMQGYSEWYIWAKWIRSND